MEQPEGAKRLSESRRQLLFASVRASPRRVRRVMCVNGVLAPHRVGRTETRPHDGTIVSDNVNEVWEQT
jgi:putative transposase